MDYQTQGLYESTDYSIVNDIQLMVNAVSMARAIRFQGITVETELLDGHLKCVYRGTADKILEKVELAFKNHSTDNLIPVTTLVSILPPLIASSETEELTAFTDFKATFGKSRAKGPKNYRDLILGQHQKVSARPHRRPEGDGESSEGGR